MIKISSFFTKCPPHPVSLSEGVNDHREAHGGHHAEVRECEVHHKKVGWSSQTLDLEENVANTSISKQVDHPEHKEGYAHNTRHQGVLGREAAPVVMDDLHGRLHNSDLRDSHEYKLTETRVG